MKASSTAPAAAAAAGPAFTPVKSVVGVVEGARAAFDSGKTRSLEWRRAQLKAVMRMCREHDAEMRAALMADLRRPAFEAELSELAIIVSEAKHAFGSLDAWTAPQPVATPVALLPGSSWVQPQPLGVVAVIAPWNFPINLLLCPVVAAIAAGNAVVMKPSELAPACAALLGRLVAEYLDNDGVRVVQGAVAETVALLACRFDHIFYTGNGAVGSLVLTAAAKHLTPCTLELGGKSPAVVAPSANLRKAAHRLVSGKLLNCGQTCVAPDYVLVVGGPERAAALVAALRDVLREFYGPPEGMQASPDIGRIVNRRHWDRVTGYLASCGGSVALGGGSDAKDLWLEPTVVVAPRLDSALMTEEIFGPILPVLTVASLDAACAFVTSRPKPLALYVFAESSSESSAVLASTTSGGAVVNDTLMHLANAHLPFGGVGASGMGNYHGRFGFDTFSHMRAVYQPMLLDLAQLRYPPYSAGRLKVLGALMRAGPTLPTVGVRDLLIVGLAVAVGVLAAKVAGYPGV